MTWKIDVDICHKVISQTGERGEEEEGRGSKEEGERERGWEMSRRNTYKYDML